MNIDRGLFSRVGSRMSCSKLLAVSPRHKFWQVLISTPALLNRPLDWIGQNTGQNLTSGQISYPDVKFYH